MHFLLIYVFRLFLHVETSYMFILPPFLESLLMLYCAALVRGGCMNPPHHQFLSVFLEDLSVTVLCSPWTVQHLDFWASLLSHLHPRFALGWCDRNLYLVAVFQGISGSICVFVTPLTFPSALALCYQSFCPVLVLQVSTADCKRRLS